MPDPENLLATTAARIPAQPALIHPGGALTYEALSAWVDRIGAELRRQGLRPGDRLAIQMRTSLESVGLLLACLRTGLPACPMDPRLPAAGIAAAIDRLRCAALVSDPQNPSDAPTACSLSPGLWEILHDPQSPLSGEAPTPCAPAGPALILATSGSTGAPKDAALCEANLRHNARVSNRNIPVAPGDRWLLSLPFHHISGWGILFRCLLGGGAMVVPEPGAPLLEAIETTRPSHVSLVPTQWRRLMQTEAGSRALARLKAILVGGGPIPEDLLNEAAARNLPVSASYGLTEMASQIATTRPGAFPVEGLPVLEPQHLTISSTGEVLVRGPALFMGYAQGNRYERPLSPRGWFGTRDLGVLDPQGRLRIQGRRDNQFISGGENIQPEEIERALVNLPDIAEAIVVPVPHAEYGRRPAAFIRLRAQGQWEPERWGHSLAAVLPSYKRPDAWLPWPDETLMGGMKPSRAFLRERAAQWVEEKQRGIAHEGEPD